MFLFYCININMDPKIISAGLVMLIIGVFTVAVSSISIQCFNKHKDFKTEKETNFNFTIVALASGVLTILIGSSAMATAGMR